MATIQFIDETPIQNKRVLLREDFNVSLNPDFSIADDARIRQAIPTINLLLQGKNRIILISHLGRPKGRDAKYSLKNVGMRLQQYLGNKRVILVEDFINTPASFFEQQKEDELLLLENIRFYPEEQTGDDSFAAKIAALGEIYVNDAFGVSHRPDASIVAITKHVSSFGGLLLKKEIQMISKAVDSPQKPFVAILGGAKISTKINLVGKLMQMTDHLLIGGGMANIFLLAQGFDIGKSFYEQDQLEAAMKIVTSAKEQNVEITLPQDAVVAPSNDANSGDQVKKIAEIGPDDSILDIGPETQARFGSIIAQAKTLIWNGPVGYIENPLFRRGTDFIYYSITQNSGAISIVGGGDTLAAISKKEYLDKITHVSTGGGAMLEFIEKGTLPGIEALRH